MINHDSGVLRVVRALRGVSLGGGGPRLHGGRGARAARAG